MSSMSNATVEGRSKADAALSEEVALALAKGESRGHYAKDWKEKRKQEEAGLRAEADACAAAGVEMDAVCAARLAAILKAKEKQAKQTKDRKLTHEEDKKAYSKQY
jgi:uncharacterized protein YgiB involved in biofilm formation